MYSVMIVDDEPTMRQGIRNLVVWEEYGLEVIHEADHGGMAWRLIEKNVPDIIITDIKMPIMNGLELIKKCSEQGLTCKFIIISGYDDFKYVKEALKYNVENYLLKPIDRYEFVETMKEILLKHEREEAILQQVKESEIVLESNLLNRIIKNNISYEEFRDKADVVGLDICDDYLQVAVIDCEIHKKDKAVRIQFNQEVMRACNTYIKESDTISFVDMDGRTVIIFKMQQGVTESSKKELEAIQNQLHRIQGMQFSITVGQVVDSYKQLHRSYSQALDIQCYRLVKDANKIIYYEHVMNYRSAYPQHITINYTLLNSFFHTGKSEELLAYAEEIFGQAMEERSIAPGFFYNIAMEFLIYANKALKDCEGEQQKEWTKNIPEKVMEFNSPIELSNWVINILRDVMEQIDMKSDKKYSLTVTKVLTYIHDHYNEDISLKTVSSVMYTNTAYLGRVFKKETGKVFSEYLTDMRMEKAKMMLSNSNLKNSDIANRVGYRNSNYFYSLFKKYTGLTPTEFRSSIISGVEVE